MARANPDDSWGALMAAAQDGDKAAYERLLRAIAPVLRSLARRHGLDPSSAEDATQETMLTIHRIRDTYDPARPFGPWLVAIARRRIVDHRRREGRRERMESHDPGALETFAAPEANDPILDEERARWLRLAIATLPPRQREAVEMTKVQDLSVAEAASRSGQTQGAVKVNVHRAIGALRRRLGREL